MSIVSSNEMLVKRESTSRLNEMLVKSQSTSRLPIKNSESCSTISAAKANESFTVFSLLVKDFKIVCRNLLC